MISKRFWWAACLAVLLLGVRYGHAATALTGSSGLLFVPTAEVVPDGCFSFGGIITDHQAFPAKAFSHFQGDNKPSFYFGGYLAFGFLPRLEVTVRGNGMPWSEGPAGPEGPFYMDGMISMQCLVWRGSGWVPSLAVGMQDIYGFLIFNATYGVATWRVSILPGSETVVTAGWAVDWYDRHIGTSDADSNYEVLHVMDGFVVGLEHPLTEKASILVEYDSRALNVGCRLRLASWCTLDLAAVRWSVDNIRNARIRGFAAHLHFDGAL